MDEINTKCSCSSQSSANNNHKRTIIHIDMDYFYAQVEEIRDSSLRNKPLGIQQKNIVVTSNYIARDFGIKKLMNVQDAKKLCPHLVLISGEDLTPYRQMSIKISEILHKFTPIIEKLGLDENFLDVSDLVNQRINGNFDNVKYDVKGCIYPIDSNLNDCNCGCAERLTIGTNLAKEIRNELYKSLGITCSAGISHNKLLAKLVGNLNKPNNQTVLVANAAHTFMTQLNCLSKITGIGQKTEAILLENGIGNITELQNCNLEWLKSTVTHDLGVKLKDLSFGIDQSAVKPTGKPKTIGLEDSCRPISVGKDVEERYRLLLMRLIGQVSEDGRIPVTLKIIIRKFDTQKKTSHRETKQANILPSLFRVFNDGQIMLADGAQEKLLKIIMRLFERIVDMSKPFNITLLGLAFSKFQDRKSGSSSIASFLIKKTDLEVQSVTSLTNILPMNSQQQTPSPSLLYHHHRRTSAPSPIPMLVDMESMSSDFSDFSETEIEPSPKKTRLGLLIAKRRCLSPTDSSDTASPSKLRVAELRLNSRDSDKDITSSPIATAIPIRMFTKSPKQKIKSPTTPNTTNFNAFTKAKGNFLVGRKILECNRSSSNRPPHPHKIEANLMITETTPPAPIHTNSSSICASASITESTTILTGNLTNIPCPSGVDPNVFQELPEDVQNELINSWRHSLTHSSNSSSSGGSSNNASTTSTNKTGSRTTLHRYFIRNK